MPIAVGTIFGSLVSALAFHAVESRNDQFDVTDGAESPGIADVDADSAIALMDSLDRLARESPSAERSAERNSLLMKLVELNPQAAVRYSQLMRADSYTIATLFATWAETDLAAALRELEVIERPALLRSVSIALLDVIGTNSEGIARVAAAVPAADRLNFTFDAIASHAAEDALAAIGLALDLEDLPAQTEAVSRVARELAQRDPLAALVYSEAIESYALGDVYRSVVLEEMAAKYPEDFFAWVQSAKSADIPSAGTLFEFVAEVQSERLLALLDEIPEGIRPAAERAALEALAPTNPGAVFAHIATSPPGAARDRLFTSTARTFALSDAQGALVWVNALEPPSSAAMTGVLQAFAETQPVLGAEILIEKLTSRSINSLTDLSQIIPSFTPGSPEELALVADALSAREDPIVRTAYEYFMDYWSRNDPVAVYNSVVANPNRVTASSIYLARSLTRAQPELAKDATALLPPAARDAWIGVVAGELARASANDALDWIARYQGQPVYEGALESVLESVTMSGEAQSIAAFLDNQSAELRADSIARVAFSWAGQDPEAAVRWVESAILPADDENRRSAAYVNIAAIWAQSEPEAAREWALRLMRGEQRDRVLASLMGATAQAGEVDPRAIEAFSTVERGQRELANTMFSLGQYNPTLGQQLIDRYISDPEIRTQARASLDRGIATPANRNLRGTALVTN
jgi:hypothetical protein